MTTPPRPRPPRALRPRRTRRGAMVAVAIGVLGAVVLVGLLGPDDTGVELAPLPAAELPPPAQRVVSAPSPAPITPAPTQPAVGPESEPVLEGPTAAEQQWFRAVVVDGRGEEIHGAGLVPVVCEGFGMDRREGLYYATAPGRCIVEAVKRDGALFRRSEQATLTLRPDSPPQTVRLELPEERTGGIGVRFLPVSSGMRVAHVIEGGPAWEAGLEVGDVIVSVDDEAVDGLDQQEFVRRMTGPEGSDVTFEVLYSEEDAAEPVVERVQVKRRFLEG